MNFDFFVQALSIDLSFSLAQRWVFTQEKHYFNIILLKYKKKVVDYTADSNLEMR